MEPPDVISSQLNLADPAHGGAPATTAGEVEPAVNLLNVLDHQLFLGFHLEVLADPTAPAEKVRG